MMDNIVDSITKQLAYNAARKVIIKTIIEAKKAGVKPPIGIYQDCRDLGYNFVKEEVERDNEN